jgi:hypothetical protein
MGGDLVMRFVAFSALAFASLFAYGAADDFVFTQRNSMDTGPVTRVPPHPTSGPGVFHFDPSSNSGSWITFGPGLSVNFGVLNLNITSGQVTSALGFTPYSSSNPAGYLTGISGAQVTSALGFTPYSASNPAGYISGVTGGQVATALGFTPYDSANPSGYVNQAGARAAITLTTTGSGAATYVGGNLNIPTPASAAPFNYGAINSRSFASSTAYQATDNTKAAVVKVSPSCTASLSLTAGGTCTIQARIGSSGLTCSSGTVVATWTNANTGTLTVGLGLNQTVGSPGNIELAIGEYFILCPTAGTFTIANGTDRSQG